MEYWVTADKSNHLTNVSSQYQQEYQKVYVPNYKTAFLEQNYTKVILNNNGTITFPTDLTITQDNNSTISWQNVENNFISHYGLSQPITTVDFTGNIEALGKFDSYNYQFSAYGLLLNTDINLDTGLIEPARFRALNLPLVKNQFALTTVKVPKTIQNRGQDFSFWYFNNKNKYGCLNGISNFDATEFDVDEIRGNIHASTIYDKSGNSTYETPTADPNFYKEYHTLGIKWTDTTMDFLLDTQTILHRNVVTENDTMFPTWEIETPVDGLSTTFMGHVHSEDYPTQAIIKSYKVYQL